MVYHVILDARHHSWYRQTLLMIFIAGFIFGRFYFEHRREVLMWGALAADVRRSTIW
jgi:hypothetical protein